MASKRAKIIKHHRPEISIDKAPRRPSLRRSRPMSPAGGIARHVMLMRRAPACHAGRATCLISMRKLGLRKAKHADAGHRDNFARRESAGMLRACGPIGKSRNGIPMAAGESGEFAV